MINSLFKYKKGAKNWGGGCSLFFFFVLLLFDWLVLLPFLFSPDGILERSVVIVSSVVVDEDAEVDVLHYQGAEHNTSVVEFVVLADPSPDKSP